MTTINRSTFIKILSRGIAKFLPFGEARWGSLLLLLLLFSCTNEVELDLPVSPRNVLLVYMGGDNNLSDETDQKIEAIRSGWKASDGDKLLIYQDAAGTAPTLTEIVNRNGQNTLNILKTYPEENSADPEVFARVISEVHGLYPLSGGRKASLLVFSHASGWLPKGALLSPRSTTRSIIIDGSDEMNLTDFATAIPDNTFDYIVFEACFMAGIEVAYELKDKTNYILASSAEIVSPGFTESYPQTINNLFENTPNLTQFAQSSFDYFSNNTGYEQSATFSIIKTSELDNLADFVKNNCDFNKEISLNDIQHFDRYSYRLFFDFEDYYSSLLENDTQKTELSALIEKAVIWKAATPSFMIGYNGFIINKHSGLTSYIPQERFAYLNNEYQKLKWSDSIIN
ncbi:cysteine peptidase C11 family protein [Dysgonomonas alginatilytica]|uniref:Cysteine peptidase C11 family protein n=1 Tax=Dysgonomonas alginatilytica TaxID=1605892 RepID=A0A2V3PLE2_9BACT|nr:clostripain-related cysteine peptidase [Dysgonomonas alginatilytica]PXV59441.1 cysteine peptidase C11 family protein [Dysgonomonas alginatilytica]